MKFVLSFLFFIGITLSSIHELEHINGEHEHPSCEICSINDTLSTPELTECLSLHTYVLQKRKDPKALFDAFTQNPKHNTPNAPPSFA